MRFGKSLATASMLAALSVVAQAAPDHDPVLEEAAIRLTVSRLGPLRGGFGPGEKPVFQLAGGQEAAASDAEAWQDGLAPAVELRPVPRGGR